jgi:glc operon protein GlcG
MQTKSLFIVTLLVIAGNAGAADTRTVRSLTLEGAERVSAAAVEYAKANNAPGGAIAVVDAGGHIVLVRRLDGTFAAGAEISIGKARTAVMFQRPTRGIEETINKGRTAMTPVAAVTWFTPLQGGIPIIVDGEVVGGIGVSGAASAQQDEEIAIAGAAAAQSGTRVSEVRFIDATQVAAAFAAGDTGTTLVDDDAFRINASRRDDAGLAESHAEETDIFYVLEGSADVVTSGRIVEPQTIAPGELRGAAIDGGNSLRIAAGDVLTIPNGHPHWFRTVHPPFRYFVVKSLAAQREPASQEQGS